jgi:HupE/UreJ protein
VRRHARGRAIVILAAAILAFSVCRLMAHEVPSELTVDAFLKPEHHTLNLLIRVPLSGLMGIDMPKEGVGYLALARIDPSLRKAAALMADQLFIYENGTRLASPQIVSTRISLPFDTSFESYDAALAHLMGPALPVDTQIYWLQGSVDALIEYPIASDRSDFSFQTGLTRLAPQVTTALHFLPPDGSTRAFAFVGDPGTIWLDPYWYRTGQVFFKEGFKHVLGLRDQWLFALCMLIAFSRLRSLPMVLASFGAGQFITSLVIAFGPDATGVWLMPLVSTVAAAFLMGFAIENIAARDLDRRWTTLFFGVISGVGFSVAMREIAQFAGDHRLMAIVTFDLGLQAGELALFALVTLPLLILSRVMVNERLRTIVASACLADLAWHALLARGSELDSVQWPIFTPEVLVTATSWLIVVVVAAGVLWFVAGLLKSHQARPTPSLSKAEGR